MPILYTQTYPRDLFNLNPKLMCVYIESHTKRGGDPATVQVRGLERSLPLTLKENFSSEGHLSSDTEMRDTRLIEAEFLPTLLLADELLSLEKRTPKVEQYLSKRLNEVKVGFPLLGL